MTSMSSKPYLTRRVWQGMGVSSLRSSATGRRRGAYRDKLAGLPNLHSEAARRVNHKDVVNDICTAFRKVDTPWPASSHLTIKTKDTHSPYRGHISTSA